MKSSLQFGFQLGEYYIKPLLGSVTGPDGEHHIQPKAADVLLCLAEARGEVVERSALLRRVWGDEGNHSEGLNHCISELRHALGDHHDHPEYIQTIHRRGYRLVAEVVADDEPEATTAPAKSASTVASLWDELKQRNVVRVAIGYAAVSWLLLQFADIVFDILKLPDWALTVFFLLLGVGFLIALIVAWLFQVVPEHRAEEHQQRQAFKTTIDVGIIVVLAIAVGLLAYRQYEEIPLFPGVADLPDDVVSPQPNPKSVAVMRFANFGGDNLFSNGLGEHLLNLLARTGELEVPSRQVTWTLSDQRLDPRSIAAVLRVRYLVEGSVQQYEQRIRVTAQLIDGNTGNHVWSEHYDEVLTANNFFKIQDAIARQVVSKLEATIAADAVDPDTRPDNIEALSHYLAGREELNKPKSASSLAAAVSAFEKAIDIEPHYAAAHAGLCEAHLAFYVTYRDTEHFDNAEASCVRALRIDAGQGEVYAALGSLHRYAGQYDLAQSELERARELLNDPAHVLEELGRTYRAQNKLILAEQTFNEAIIREPANWSVYKSMANFLFRTGRFEAALPYYKQVTVMQRDSAVAFSNIGAAFFMLGDFANATVAWERSLELEPTHFAYMNVGNSLYYQGRYADSVQMYREAIELGANDARAWGSLAASCARARGRDQCTRDAYARAIELIEESLAINPNDPNALARLAAYLARTDRREEARDILAELDAMTWEDPDVPLFMAYALVETGNDDDARSKLRQAILMGHPRVLVAADPSFRNLTEGDDFLESPDIQLN